MGRPGATTPRNISQEPPYPRDLASTFPSSYRERIVGRCGWGAQSWGVHIVDAGDMLIPPGDALNPPP
jgi:hypothetical protein